MTTTDTVWLKIDDHTEVGISRVEAMRMTEKDFAKLYRKTVYRSTKREAKDWGKKQVKVRERALRDAPQGG